MSGPDARAGCEGWVRGPPVRMPRRRAPLRLNGAVQREDMRAGGPRTQDCHSQNTIALEKVDFAKAPMTGILSSGVRLPG